MKPPLAAPHDFKLRRGKPRVWRWLEDARITIRERENDSGGTGYRVTLPKSVTGGKVRFFQSRDLNQAFEIARSKGRDFRESRATAMVLSDADKIQAAEAKKLLAKHKLDLGLDEAVKLLALALSAANKTGKTLQQVVEYAVERLLPSGGLKTLAEVIEMMTEEKRSWLKRGDLREASFRDFHNRGGRIAQDLGSFPLPDLTKQILYDWLVGLNLARRTKRNYRMVLSEILGYAKQKQLMKDNPLEQFTRTDIKNIEGLAGSGEEPSILSLDQAERLITCAFERPELDLGAAVTLGLFAGIRTEELKRLTWNSVRLRDPKPFVKIGAEIAKKRRIRNVPLPTCAVAWLDKWIAIKSPEGHSAKWPDAKAVVTRSTHQNDFQKRFQKLCREAKIEWAKNSMRHSFGSYDYEKDGDSVETARKLGHKQDDQVLFDHYRALVSPGQGEAYFAITPKTEIVIQFPQPAAG